MPYANPKDRKVAWRKANPEASRAATQRHRARRLLWLTELKDKPCTDCRRKYPRACMEFDHVRGPKLFEVNGSTIAWQSKKATLLELAKCELVCANCHRIRTEARRNK